MPAPISSHTGSKNDNPPCSPAFKIPIVFDFKKYMPAEHPKMKFYIDPNAFTLRNSSKLIFKTKKICGLAPK